MKTEYAGIDYGLGQSNVDKSNGIRYGVIPQHEVLQAWADSSEPYYGKPHCPHCGNEAVERHCKVEQLENGVAVTIDDEAREEYEPNKYGFGEYACDDCKRLLSSDDVWPDSPLSFSYQEKGYAAECGEDGDIFIVKSPFFTRAQFCSPCAPGAGYLMNPCEDGPKSYCFGHDWFDDGKAPYPVYSVETGEQVEPESR